MADNTTESMAANKSVSSETRKTISLYNIASLDNLGFTITQVQLKGGNYEEWDAHFELP